MPELKLDNPESLALIVVVGVGGAGGSAVNRMKSSGLQGVKFVSINTDSQALANSLADVKIHIGKQTTRGLGAGADPIVGQKAAEESREEIANALEGSDMIFIAAGEGGGTGTGAAHVVATIAKELGILVVGVVTRPFNFEGEKRRRNAEWGIKQITPHVDTLITIPNDRLLQSIDRDTSLVDAFRYADDVLRQGVQGIADLITEHGLINLDFADVKTVMSNAGTALMGIGRASGENRAISAAQQAIESPLLEISIDGARGVLFSVAGSRDLSMHEINEAAEVITSAVSPDANIIFGATLREDLDDEVIITVIATGFDPNYFNSRPGSGFPSLDAELDNNNDFRSYSNNEIINEATRIDVDEPTEDSGGLMVKHDVGDISRDLDEEPSSTPQSSGFSGGLTRFGRKRNEELDDLDDYKPEETSNDSEYDSEDEDDDEMPAFLRRLKRNKKK